MVIYCIENTANGKKYIGQTIGNGTYRKSYHFTYLKRGCHDNPYLQNAYNKYGKDCFVFSVLANCVDLEQLNLVEQKLIERYHTMNRNKGYNLQSGGKNCKLSESTRKKIGKASQKMWDNKSQKERDRLSNITRQRSYGNTYGTINKGIKRSAETCKRIADYQRNRKTQPRAKPIYIIMPNGNILATCKSMVEAEKTIGGHRRFIRDCLNGKRQLYYGFNYQFIN